MGRRQGRRHFVKHGVTFEQALLAFDDLNVVEWIDDSERYGEERTVLIGMAGDQLLYVVYTEREDRIRIIMARKADRNEHDHYYRQKAR